MRNLFGSAVKIFAVSAFIVTAASAQVMPGGTRGLEQFNIDQYVSLVQKGDFAGLQSWLAKLVPPTPEVTSVFDTEFVGAVGNLISLADHLNKTNPVTAKMWFARKAFELQQDLRKSIVLGTNLDKERRVLVLFQTMIEEAVMANGDLAPKVFQGLQLTGAEKAETGTVRGVPVLPGDVIIQIGSTYMSSHFIAHSQSNPGLASHSYVISKGGAAPEVLEALIEDGVNRRDPTNSQLARFWVLSLDNPLDRAKAAQATADFINKEKILFVATGQRGIESPLLYDSTMNPDRKKDGYYFCSALVQEIYQRSGVNRSQVPYLADQSNWNSLQGIEQGVYRQIDIEASRVPAPSDVLFQPEFAVRAMVLDPDGLKKSRRLRAVVDAFFDIISSQPAVRAQLLAAFQKIPKQEINKRQVLAALAGLELPNMDKAAVEKLRAKLEESLPQTANLRQIAFFVILNAVIQDKALAALDAFETQKLQRHATPGELRAQAAVFMGEQFAKIQAALGSVKAH